MKLTFEQIELDSTTNILNIDVPPEMEHNVSTGHKQIDTMFAGDGVTPSTVTLVTGGPGAGKSTLMAQLANSITASGNIALVNAGEESLYQVRRTANRLKIKEGFIVGQDRNVNEVIKHVLTLQTKYPNKQVFLIQDSLQCLEVPREKGERGRPPSGDVAALRSLERITEWTKSTFGIAFVIGHVNKKNEFQGKNGIKHTVDCHLHLGKDKAEDDDFVATATLLKNRFGIAYVDYEYELTETGLQFKSI